MGFRDYTLRLTADIPKLAYENAQLLINDALAQIYKERLWSFLLQQSYIVVPQLLTTGLCAFTQGSPLVVPNSTAKTKWDTFAADNNLSITSCAIRGSGGQPYQIAAYDPAGAGSLTLEQPFEESTSATASYQIYRPYVTPPLAPDSTGALSYDFTRYLYVLNRVQGYSLNILRHQWELNAIDPIRRSISSDSYWIAPFDTVPSKVPDGLGSVLTLSTGGQPRHELYPHPTTARNLFCIFQRKGAALVKDDDDIPDIISRELLLARARYLAYEWADSNKGVHRELAVVNWMQKQRLIMDPTNRGGYPMLLAWAKKNDEERVQSNWLKNYYLEIMSGSLGVGSDFARNHAFSVSSSYL